MSKVIFRNAAVVKTTNSFTYNGNGYKYTTKIDPVDDCMIAYLQISQAKLDAFYASVGKANSLHLHGIRVVRIGAWTRIIALRPLTNGMVSQFLRRLNSWVLKHVAVSKAAGHKRHHYFVEAPLHLNRATHNHQRPVTQTAPHPVDLSRLLAAQTKLRPTLAPMNR